jgi:HPt (histidine-containing phosphotransfer) domain-containing protein
MDGVEATALIRALPDEKYGKLPIIALTANAVQGAREMFLSNGFNDFISKPINSHELVRVLEAWLPPEKVKPQEEKKDNRQTKLDKEQLLRQKSIGSFVKENRNTYEKISEALSEDDFKTAHRIAHTLKSIAGYLGRDGLQKAAEDLEDALRAKIDGSGEYTQAQLNLVETELHAALSEFEPTVAAMESEKKLVRADEGRINELISELEPLLKKSDFGAADYLEELQETEGMEELAERIDNYDFEGAYLVITSLKNKIQKG